MKLWICEYFFVSDSIRRTTYNTKLKHTATLKSSQANVSCNRSIPSLFCWEIGKQNVLCPLAAKIFVAENIKWGWDFHKKKQVTLLVTFPMAICFGVRVWPCIGIASMKWQFTLYSLVSFLIIKCQSILD